MKFLGNSAVFACVYILFMIPTYWLPYLGSNSSIVGGVNAVAGGGATLFTIFHLIALAVLIAITWFRGALVDRTWLVILPIVAAVFDMVPGLSLIPLVPTIMHIFTLIKGLSEKETMEEKSS